MTEDEFRTYVLEVVTDTLNNDLDVREDSEIAGLAVSVVWKVFKSAKINLTPDPSFTDPRSSSSPQEGAEDDSTE